MHLNLLLVDNHILLRQGLKSMLCSDVSIINIYEAETVDEVNKVLAKHKVDVILSSVKVHNSNALLFFERIKKTHPHVKLIAFAGIRSKELILNLLKCGIDGLIPESYGCEEVKLVIRQVMGGGGGQPPHSQRGFQRSSRGYQILDVSA